MIKSHKNSSRKCTVTVLVLQICKILNFCTCLILFLFFAWRFLSKCWSSTENPFTQKIEDKDEGGSFLLIYLTCTKYCTKSARKTTTPPSYF